MALAAEALLRLRAVLDDEGFRKAQGALKGLDAQAKATGSTIGSKVNRPLDGMSRGLDRIENSAAVRNVDRALVGTSAGLAGAVKLAIDFEKEFGGVRKQLGLNPNAPILDTYRRQLLDLSTRTPTAAAALARIATEGARIGLRDAPLLDYVDQIQRASKALEIPAEELVGNFNGINAALQLKPAQGYRLLDAINNLDDNLPANVNSRQILEGLSRMGAIPRVAGLRAEDTAALLAPIIGSNIAPEMAATGLKNFLVPLAGGSLPLTKEKRNLLAQLYGYDDPGLKFLRDQKGAIVKEIESIEKGIEKRGLKLGLSAIDQRALTADVDQAIRNAELSGNKQLLKQLRRQRRDILDQARDGLVTDKRSQLLDRARLKELKAQLSGINEQIKARPGGEAFGAGVANNLASRLQADPQGTILEVIDRLNSLPQDRRLGFVQELFGRESAAQIMTLVDNAKLLRQSFELIDPKATLGSVKREYDTLLQGAPAQLEMFKNALMAPAIEIGRTLLPALLELTRALKPMIDGFSAYIRANPQAVQQFVKASAAVLALRAGLWALGGVVATLQGVVTVLRAIGAAGVFLGGLPRTIAGTLGAVGPLLQRLMAMFGGVGGSVGGALSTVLRPTAGGGGGGFFSGLINAAKAVPGMVMAALRDLPGMVQGLVFSIGKASGGLTRFLGLDKAAIGMRTFMDTLRGFTPTMVLKGGEWVTPWTVRLATALRGVLPVLALVGRAVAGVFTGPVGWVTLLVSAGVALYAFRNQIGQFAATVAPMLATAFQPLQTLLSGISSWMAGIFANLGAAIAPAWGQISNLFNTYVVTPIQTTWNFLVVWIGQTVAAYAITWWSGIAAGFNLYVVTPLQQIWASLMNALAIGAQQIGMAWNGISQAFISWVVVPVQTAWVGLTTYLGQGVANLRMVLGQAWAGVAQAFYTWVVAPISGAWSGLVQLFYGSTAALRMALSGAWQGVAQAFTSWVVLPINNAWNALNSNIRNAWNATVQFFRNAWTAVTGGIINSVITPLQNMFTGLANRIRSIFDGLVNWARSVGNWVVDRVNPVRQAAGFSPLQRFAKGGYVNGPTLGLVGEGGDSEYIIPSRKMAGASMAYLSGARGPSVLNAANNIRAFAKGGFVGASGLDFSKSRSKKKANSIKSFLGPVSFSAKGPKTIKWLGASIRTPSSWLPFGGRDYTGVFAKGGFITKPTLGLVGEGGDSEYIIPSRKMAASSMAYLAGARGMGVVNPPKFADGGFVGSRQNRSANLDNLVNRASNVSQAGGSISVGNTTIVVQTGDIRQDVDGEQWLTLKDYERGLAQVQRETMALLRTAAGRRATGRR